MPTIDPKTGKRISGAAQRKAVATATAVAVANQAKRPRAKKPKSVGLDFDALPLPPLNDPLGAMVWWNDVLLTCADKVLRDPCLTLEARVRFLADFSAKAGMIRDKASEAKAIKTALAATEKTKVSSGLEKTTGPAPAKIQKPPL